MNRLSYSYVDKLMMLKEAADAYETAMPGKSSRFFKRAIESFIEGNNSLNDSLGLSKTDVNKFHYMKRDKYLNEARRYCFTETETEKDKAWLVSKKLNEIVNEFREIEDDIDFNKNTLDEWSELRKCIFKAMQYGKKFKLKALPKNTDGIHKIYLAETRNIAK